jgi:hypothetical protein
MGDKPGHQFRGNQWTANPGKMTGAELTKAQDVVEAQRLSLGKLLDTSAMNAGLGAVGYAQNREVLAARGQKQAVEDEKAMQARVNELRAEVEARAGAGYRRLPHGVGSKPRVRDVADALADQVKKSAAGFKSAVTRASKPKTSGGAFAGPDPVGKAERKFIQDARIAARHALESHTGLNSDGTLQGKK